MADLILTADQCALARRALGLPNRQRRNDRNHYLIASGCDTHNEWYRMIGGGAAALNRRLSGTQMVGSADVFHLTKAGAEAALEPGETLDMGYFPDG